MTESNNNGSDGRNSRVKMIAELLKQKKEFIRWVFENFKSPSMRRMAVEYGAYHFTNELYDLEIENFRCEMEKRYDFKLRLIERFRKLQIQQFQEYERLKSAMMELKQGNLRILQDSKRLLQKPDFEKEKIERIVAEDKRESIKLKLEQKKRRFWRKAMAAEAAERARLRTQFIQQVRKEIDDPELLEQIIDDYDRFLHEMGG